MCVNSAGDYLCQCASGYEGNPEIGCVDINECLDSPCDHTCTNSAGGYSCSCDAGYLSTGDKCSDINECDTFGCGNNATCANLVPGFSCTCVTGYSGGSHTNPASAIECVEINECAASESNTCHVDADCTNTDGSFSCTCHTGYAGNGIVCSDTNECDASPCPSNSTCSNVEGGYTCDCVTGYDQTGVVGKATNCRQVDECTAPTSLYASTCDHDCTDTDGSFECSCKTGYSLGTDFKTCSNHDECIGEGGGNNCTFGLASCEDTEGSYECTCKTGFDGPLGDGTDCSDINECDVYFPCRQVCSNIFGSFECACNPGYSLDANGKTCSDINECETGDRQCIDPNSHCVNSVGSVACVCNDGFEGDGDVSCTNTNECEAAVFPCDANANCIDRVPFYTCVCKSGFVGDGSTCTDINECASPGNGCDATGGTCRNFPGGYECACRPGLVTAPGAAIGTECVAANECEISEASPPNNVLAMCQFTSPMFDSSTGAFDASYDCNQPSFSACAAAGCCWHGDDGSSWLGSDCVFAASSEVPRCSGNATCTDTDGSYSCDCNLGFYDPVKFAFPDAQASLECAAHVDCSTSPCVLGTCSMVADAIDCDCTGSGGEGIYCQDTADECSDFTDDCDANANCINTLASFECECSDGWQDSPATRLPGLSCVNADECNSVLQPHQCPKYSTCADTIGSYECNCNVGYTKNRAGTLCELFTQEVRFTPMPPTLPAPSTVTIEVRAVDIYGTTLATEQGQVGIRIDQSKLYRPVLELQSGLIAIDFVDGIARLPITMPIAGSLELSLESVGVSGFADSHTLMLNFKVDDPLLYAAMTPSNGHAILSSSVTYPNVAIVCDDINTEAVGAYTQEIADYVLPGVQYFGSMLDGSGATAGDGYVEVMQRSFYFRSTNIAAYFTIPDFGEAGAVYPARVRLGSCAADAIGFVIPMVGHEEELVANCAGISGVCFIQ